MKRISISQTQTNDMHRQYTQQYTQRYTRLQHVLGIVFALFLVPILLVTSAELLLYWIPNYFEYEYTKHNVLDTVPMEMEDLLVVTDEMMSYLRGDRDNLHIETTIQGQAQEFFNQREIEHMKDVQYLFLLALSIRRWCVVFNILIILILIFLRTEITTLLTRSIWFVTLFLCLFTGGLSLLISRDFTRYFIKFHELFFTNDLWILDPETDLLINIVPEPFFIDTASYIALIFVALLVLTGLAFTMFHVKHSQKKLLR